MVESETGKIQDNFLSQAAKKLTKESAPIIILIFILLTAAIGFLKISSLVSEALAIILVSVSLTLILYLFYGKPDYFGKGVTYLLEVELRYEDNPLENIVIGTLIILWEEMYFRAIEAKRPDLAKEYRNKMNELKKKKQLF